MKYFNKQGIQDLNNALYTTGQAAKNAARAVSAKVASARIGASIYAGKYVQPRINNIKIAANKFFYQTLPTYARKMRNGLYMIGNRIARVSRGMYRGVRGFIVQFVTKAKQQLGQIYTKGKRAISAGAAKTRDFVKKVDDAYVKFADKITYPAKKGVSKRKTEYNLAKREAVVRRRATAMELGTGYLALKGIKTIGELVSSKEDDE